MERCDLLSLECNHAFCATCLSQQLAARWPGPRVVFGYLNCGFCRTLLAHEDLEQPMSEHLRLRQLVVTVAEEKFREDGLDRDLSEVFGRAATHEEVRARAEEAMAVFMCGDCDEPYCGGRADCAALREAEAERQICQKCEWKFSPKEPDQRCLVHGHRLAIYKCDSCCNIAVWCCDGHRLCDRCHEDPCNDKHYPCPGPEFCPLGIPHSRNTTGNVNEDKMLQSFVIGCTSCLGHPDDDDLEDHGEGEGFGYPDREWMTFTSGHELLMKVGE